ncbi:hypothetical protein OHT57_05535 [Streptomyces sp. NBC_00285]|uniref:hypothetical protein n=1 Tax=Streptomyces sp. NBC_00285 TaxID=2975700 RepID=UPI002E2851A8|nr:hypothetical protein [Streptomyces sp. NBC_00285]
MTSVWPALVAVALLAAVEAREARTTVAAVASTGRGTAVRAALLPGLALVASAGGALGVLAVLPGGWAVRAGGIVVLVAGLQWLVWAARRELGTVPPRDEPSVYDAVRGEGAAVGAALLRAGMETLVLATAVVALAGARPLWLPPLALLLVTAAITPGLTGRRPGSILGGRPFETVLAGHRAATGVPGLRPGAGRAGQSSEAGSAGDRTGAGVPGRRPVADRVRDGSGGSAECRPAPGAFGERPVTGRGSGSEGGPVGWGPANGLAGLGPETVPPTRRTDVGPAPRRPLTVLPERPVKAAIAVLLTAQGAAAVTSDAVGVPLATLLGVTVLLALTAYGRLIHARVPRRDLPHARVPRPRHPRPPVDPQACPSPSRVLRDFVLGDDLAVWWAAAVLVLAPHLSSTGLAPIPAALLLTALLAALLGRTARRPRTDPSGGDR